MLHGCEDQTGRQTIVLAIAHVCPQQLLKPFVWPGLVPTFSQASKRIGFARPLLYKAPVRLTCRFISTRDDVTVRSGKAAKFFIVCSVAADRYCMTSPESDQSDHLPGVPACFFRLRTVVPAVRWHQSAPDSTRKQGPTGVHCVMLPSRRLAEMFGCGLCRLSCARRMYIVGQHGRKHLSPGFVRCHAQEKFVWQHNQWWLFVGV